jgi:hypothetical protein
VRFIRLTLRVFAPSCAGSSPPGSESNQGAASAGRLSTLAHRRLAGNRWAHGGPVAGNFSGTVDVGCGPITVVEWADAFVVKYSPEARRLGGKGWNDDAFATVDRAGNVLVTGTCVASDALGDIISAGKLNGTIDYGSGPLTSVGDYDLFVSKHASDGRHLWTRAFGGPGEDVPGNGPGIAVDPSGNVPVAGFTTSGTIDFGGGTLSGASGGRDAFVLRLTPDGEHLWSEPPPFLPQEHPRRAPAR